MNTYRPPHNPPDEPAAGRDHALRAPAGRDSGVATVWTAVVAAACLLMVGLVLDGGAVLRARTAAFDVAGGAARAGAQQLDQAALAEGEVLLDEAGAVAAAQRWLAARDVDGDVTVTADTVTVTVHRDARLQIIRPARVSVSETAAARARATDERSPAP